MIVRLLVSFKRQDMMPAAMPYLCLENKLRDEKALVQSAPQFDYMKLQ